MTAFNDTVYLDSDVPSGPDNLKADPNNPMPQVCKIDKNTWKFQKIRDISDISKKFDTNGDISRHLKDF